MLSSASHPTNIALSSRLAFKLAAQKQSLTDPFKPVFSAYLALLNASNNLKMKNSDLENLIVVLRHDTHRDRDTMNNNDVSMESVSVSSPLSILDPRETLNTLFSPPAQDKIIKQLKSKIELLQDQLNAKLRSDVESATSQLKNATELSTLRQSQVHSKSQINVLVSTNNNNDEKIKELTLNLSNLKQALELSHAENNYLSELAVRAEKQRDKAVRSNDELVGRIVSDKMAMVEEMNKMNDLISKLQAENNLLRLEGKRKAEGGDSSADLSQFKTRHSSSESRFGSTLPPTKCLHYVRAHAAECNAVTYDSASTSGGEFLATASSDSTVKVFDVGSGRLRSTLRGSGQPMMSVDLYGDLVAAASSDKICR